MKAGTAVASVLACGFVLDAQIAVTLNSLPDGSHQIKLRNNSAMSLVAFGIAAKQVTRSAATSNTPFVVYSDPLIDPAVRFASEPLPQATQPLLPGEERVVEGLIMGGRIRTPVFGKRVFEEPIVAAGIFDDGTTTGDAALLTRLMLRRRNMLLAVETALESLVEAGRRNIPRDQLIGQFKKMAASVHRWYLPREQQVGHAVYQSVISKLMDLPEGPVGAPFPPTAFVDRETATLNRQRVALLESQPSLADWP